LQELIKVHVLNFLDLSIEFVQSGYLSVNGSFPFVLEFVESGCVLFLESVKLLLVSGQLVVHGGIELVNHVFKVVRDGERV